MVVISRAYLALDGRRVIITVNTSYMPGTVLGALHTVHLVLYLWRRYCYKSTLQMGKWRHRSIITPSRPQNRCGASIRTQASLALASVLFTSLHQIPDEGPQGADSYSSIKGKLHSQSRVRKKLELSRSFLVKVSRSKWTGKMPATKSGMGQFQLSPSLSSVSKVPPLKV